MSSPAPAVITPTDRLRARLKRLAADPRAGLVPEGRITAAEIVAVLNEIDELMLRLIALERSQAELARLAKLARDPADCD